MSSSAQVNGKAASPAGYVSSRKVTAASATNVRPFTASPLRDMTVETSWTAVARTDALSSRKEGKYWHLLKLF